MVDVTAARWAVNARRPWVAAAGLAAGYLLLTYLALRLVPGSGRPLVAVPTAGTVTAAMLLLPRRLRPLVLAVAAVGTAVFRLMVGDPAPAALGYGAGALTQTLVFTVLADRWMPSRRYVDRPGTTTQFLVGSFSAAAVGGLVAVPLVRLLTGGTPGDNPALAIWWWTAGQGIGIVALTPAAVLADRMALVRRRDWLELTGWAGALVALVALVQPAAELSGAVRPGLAWPALALALISTARLGRLAACTVVPLLVALTLALPHPDAALTLVGGRAAGYLAVLPGQVFAVVTLVTGWMIATMVSERAGSLARLEAIDVALRGQVSQTSAALSQLEELTAAISGADDLAARLDLLLRRIVRLTGADSARVLLLDPGGTHLVGGADLGLPAGAAGSTRIPLGHGFAGTIAATRRPWVLADLSAVKMVSPVLAEAGIVSVGGVPLVSDDQLVGVLHIGSRLPGRFSAGAPGDPVPLLERIAERIADTVRQAQLAEQVAVGERRTREALDALLDPVVISRPVRDDQGRLVDLVVVYTNDAADRWGTPMDASITARATMASSPSLFADYVRAYESGVPMVREMMALDLPTGRVWVDVNAQRVQEQFLITWRDVTDRVRAQDALLHNQRRFQAALDAMLDPVLIAAPTYGPDGRVVDLTVTYRNEAVPQAVPVGASLLASDSWQAPVAVGAWFDVLEDGDPLIRDAVPVGPAQEGTGQAPPAWVDLRMVRLEAEVMSVWRDVTDRVVAAEALSASETRFRAAFEDAPVGMLLLDVEAGRPHLLRANRALVQLTGWSSDRLTTGDMARLLHPDDRPQVRVRVAALLAGRETQTVGEYRFSRADRSWMWLRVSCSRIHGADGGEQLICHLEDVTDRRLAEEALARRAMYDALTGLANRHLLGDQLATMLGDLGRHERYLAVLYLDLDHFKDVNDTLGHEAGDEVIREVGRRLSLTVRAPDLAARLAGDEFVVAALVAEELQAVAIAERLVAAIGAPMTVARRRLQVRPSVGITISRDPRVTGEELLRQADVAMYHAKAGDGQGWEVYDDRLHHRAMARLAVEEELRTALREGGFRLLYQPIVDIHSGHVVSVEALLRMTGPQGGLVTPEHFIDVAEASDLIVPIGGWVLREACRELAGWDAAAAQSISLSVNVSGRQVGHRAICEQVTVATDAAGLDPRRLTLEITERVLVEAGPQVRADLVTLTEDGVRLAIDDFGTGYSSLAYLKAFPVSTVKIDRSFVADLGHGDADEAIVAAVAGLARTLDLTSVAEGVETPAQLADLRRLGCQQVQGYLTGAPMTGEELSAVLQEQHRRRSAY